VNDFAIVEDPLQTRFRMAALGAQHAAIVVMMAKSGLPQLFTRSHPEEPFRQNSNGNFYTVEHLRVAGSRFVPILFFSEAKRRERQAAKKGKPAP